MIEDTITPWLEDIVPALTATRERILYNMADMLVDQVTSDVPYQSGYLVESGTEDWIVTESTFRASIKVTYTGKHNPPSNRAAYNQFDEDFYPDKDYALFQHEKRERRKENQYHFLEKNVPKAESNILKAVAEGYWEVLQRI